MKTTEEAAARVLLEAGIELGWMDCTVMGGSARNDSSVCDAPSCSGSLLLYFVGALEEHFRWVEEKALGYSIIPETHEPATMAYVSWPRIRKLSDSTSADAAELLGLAVAHEIGHLLFGTHDHAYWGIMRSPWRLRDLRAKAWEEFRFTKDQARRLRAAMQARRQADQLRATAQK